MRHLLNTVALSTLLLAGCGGGGSDRAPDPIDAYVGQWTHCQTSIFAPASILTTWTISKTGAAMAQVRVDEVGVMPGGAPCSGERFNDRTLASNVPLALNGTKVVRGLTWDRVDYTLGGEQRELMRVAADRLEVSTWIALTTFPLPRDAQGYPDSFEAHVMNRKP